MLKSLNVPWGCTSLGFCRHSTLHWNSPSPPLLFLQSQLKCHLLQEAFPVVLVIPPLSPYAPQINLYLWSYFAFICFCVSALLDPYRAVHFIHFKFQTFIRADKVLQDLAPAHLSTLSPTTPCPTHFTQSHWPLDCCRGHQTPSCFWLFVPAVTFSSNALPWIFPWLAPSWHSDLCSSYHLFKSPSLPKPSEVVLLLHFPLL